MSDAVIRDRGYEGYAGPRTGSAQRVLALHTARTLWAKKGVRRAIILAFVPALILGVVLALERSAGVSAGAQQILSLLTRGWGTLFPSLIVALIAAGATLAEDRRAGALSFYFSRPILARDYLLGRLLGTTAIIACACAAPAIAVALVRVAQSTTSTLLETLLSLGSVVVLGSVMSLLLAGYTLLGGVLAGSRGGAQGFVALALMVPWIGAGVGARLLDGPWLSLLSLPHVVDAVGRALVSDPHGLGDAFAALTGSAEPNLPAPWMALLALVAIGTGVFALLYQRLGKLASTGGAA